MSRCAKLALAFVFRRRLLPYAPFSKKKSVIPKKHYDVRYNNDNARRDLLQHDSFYQRFVCSAA